ETDRRPGRRRPQCGSPHPGNRLPPVPVRRRRPPHEPVPLPGRRTDALRPRRAMSDVPLLRNRSGTARDRDPQAPVEELELESAIGRNVRQLRLQQGLTVAEMAARVGISKAMMSKIENAQTSCSLSTLALLASGFDVPVTSLFRGADVERPAAFVT